MEDERTPANLGLFSNRKVFEQVKALAQVVKTEKKQSGWRILQSLSNIFGAHTRVDELQEAANFLRNNKLPPDET